MTRGEKAVFLAPSVLFLAAFLVSVVAYATTGTVSRTLFAGGFVVAVFGGSMLGRAVGELIGS